MPPVVATSRRRRSRRRRRSSSPGRDFQLPPRGVARRHPAPRARVRDQPAPGRRQRPKQRASRAASTPTTGPAWRSTSDAGCPSTCAVTPPWSYADLHFLIPRSSSASTAWGPYFVRSSATSRPRGAFNFVMRDTVDENYAEAAGGSRGTSAYPTLISPTRDALKTLVAIEVLPDATGPSSIPAATRRFNLFAKAKATLAEGMDTGGVGVLLHGRLGTAQARLPARRRFRAGLISRFGSIDPNRRRRHSARQPQRRLALEARREPSSSPCTRMARTTSSISSTTSRSS